MEIRHSLLLTVVGPLLALASDRGLLRLRFLREVCEYRTEARAAVSAHGPDARPCEDPACFAPLVRQLGEYFAGQRRAFDVPLDLRGSVFQRDVFGALLEIPHGQLRTYTQVAAMLGRPHAARAVGQAVGANPVPIVVPCHRVVGADGDLVGFGGGMDLKARLLRLEGHTLGRAARVVAPRLF
ncbi:MAG: methylated-DNA--[protein]-cysteine S-methyltransferase [Candidatus Krumholzibacteriia bacterium]